MPGRSIKIFLVDGTVSGVRTAELGLSTIKAIVIPRASLTTFQKRAELLRTGIYLLIGKDEDRPGVLKIYIGEGDTAVNRLLAHDKDEAKDFWEEAVVFVSKDENLTKSHVRYLEARLISLTKQSKRCTVTNGTEPDETGKLPEADSVEMEEFITQIRLLLGTLGYELFAPLIEITKPSDPQKLDDANVTLTYSGTGFSATCVVDTLSWKFVVLAGSIFRKYETQTIPGSTQELRKTLLQTGVLTEQVDGYRLLQDTEFTSISAAATIVSGGNANGNIMWKVKGTNTTYGEWRATQSSQHDE
jgi:hypothetical protein